MAGVLHATTLALILAATGLAGSRAAPDPAALAPGQYLWHPEIAPRGPLVVIISLDEQRAYVYRNGIAIGLSTISSGRTDHRTPTGVFTILQKDREHYSNKYDSAPMPYMERLTWDGIALHGGNLPGYPASHGCVRLPQGFAERLFAVTQRGETVVVAESQGAPPQIVHPAVLAPVTASGVPFEPDELPGVAYTWNELASPEGPTSILVSIRDRRVHVLRNGIRIGSSTLAVAEDFAFHGSVVFVLMAGTEDAASPLDPARKRHRWTSYPVRGDLAAASMDLLAAKLRVPDEFARLLYPILTPGTSVLVTDLPAVRIVPASNNAIPVLESDAGEGGTLEHARQ